MFYADMERVILSVDNKRQSFLHTVVQRLSVETVRDIISSLPRTLALKLSLVEDNYGRIVRDVAAYGPAKDHVVQAGEFHTEFYQLETPPQVLIFYMTEKRLAVESCNGHNPDAEAERDCVEKYFLEKNFPCLVKKNPTADEVFNTILNSVTQAGSNLSGMIVFYMSHGSKGVLQVSVKSDRKEITVSEITHFMTDKLPDKPKV